MKKQKIQILVLGLALVALVGALFGLRKYNEKQAQQPADEEGIMIIEAFSSDIVTLSYDYEGETYSLEKVEDTWYPAGDHSRAVKPYYINGMLGGVSRLTVTDMLENVTDLSSFGLENPQRRIVFDTDIQRFQIYVGDYNSLTSSYYIQLADQPDVVYIVPQGSISRFNCGLEEILEEEAEDEAQND